MGDFKLSRPAFVVVAAMIGAALSLLAVIVMNVSLRTPSSAKVLWGEKLSGEGASSGIGRGMHNCLTFGAVVLILLFHLAVKATTSWQRLVGVKFLKTSSPCILPDNTRPSCSSLPEIGTSVIVSDFHLKNLMENLDEKFNDNMKWENIIDKSNKVLAYSAKCCKPKDGPLKYLSVTVFENCSVELLKDFYMDNEYRKSWDHTLIDHQQLQVDESSGTEIGRIVKKFPFLTPREYVLAWRLWEGEDKTFYCYSKECEHHLAPRQKKYIRVGVYRSGWRIKKVPSRNACEINMVYQEDAGLNTEMAKLAFSKGIWSYMCKMNDALRKYHARCAQSTPIVNTVTRIQKVQSESDMTKCKDTADPSETSTGSAVGSPIVKDRLNKKLPRRPSNKLITNALIVVGGVICLSRSPAKLGAKVAMAYILTKLAKRGSSSRLGR